VPRIRYEKAPDICEAVNAILESGVLPHIPPGTVKCVRSWGSRSLAIARIYGLPRAWITALGYNPGYVIEVIHERFDRLDLNEKIKVLIHELLHIPYTLSGGLRPHGKLVNSRRVNALFRRFSQTPQYRIAERALDAEKQ